MSQYEKAKEVYKKLLNELDGGTMWYFRKMANDTPFTCLLIGELVEELEKNIQKEGITV